MGASVSAILNGEAEALAMHEEPDVWMASNGGSDVPVVRKLYRPPPGPSPRSLVFRHAYTYISDKDRKEENKASTCVFKKV